MEEVLFEKLKENEGKINVEKIKQWGPHITGVVNLCCNALLYPVFQVSTQLQLSMAAGPTYHGKTFQQKVYSFIFEPHSANKPFRAQVHPTYFSAILGSSMQGALGFFKGFSMYTSQFYLSILSRSLSTSLVSNYLPEEAFQGRWKRIMVRFS